MDNSILKTGINAYKNAIGMTPIPGVGGGAPTIGGVGNSAGSGSFEDILKGSLSESADVGFKSEATSLKAMAKKASPVDLVTAVTQAELTLQTVVAMRDKMINAYQDIIKMPI